MIRLVCMSAVLLFPLSWTAAAAAQDQEDVGREVRAAAAKAGPVPRTPQGKPDLSGYWQRRSPGQAPNNNIETHPPSFLRSGGKSVIVDPADGRAPYQAWALKERDWRRLPQNSYFDPEGHCFLSGVPRQLVIGMYHILQTPDSLVTLHEYIHAVRMIHLNTTKHAPGAIRLWEGDSIGRWEGDTLVVDTTNNNGKTWFELSGNFTSDAAHQIERFKMTDANTIQYEVRIEDSKVFTRPFTIAFSLMRTDPGEYGVLQEACHEDNQDLAHLKAVHEAGNRKN